MTMPVSSPRSGLAPRKGRASIFRDKLLTPRHSPKGRVNGILSHAGAVAFEQARKRLRELYREIVGHQPGSVSDGDCVEYLARGPDETRRYLLKLHG